MQKTEPAAIYSLHVEDRLVLVQERDGVVLGKPINEIKRARGGKGGAVYGVIY